MEDKNHDCNQVLFCFSLRVDSTNLKLAEVRLVYCVFLIACRILGEQIIASRTIFKFERQTMFFPGIHFTQQVCENKNPTNRTQVQKKSPAGPNKHLAQHPFPHSQSNTSGKPTRTNEHLPLSHHGSLATGFWRHLAIAAGPCQLPSASFISPHSKSEACPQVNMVYVPFLAYTLCNCTTPTIAIM